MLWAILHNKLTEPIGDPTKKNVNLLEQTEHNKWVLSPRINEKKTRTNLVVIVEAATYFNITKKFKPLKGVESFVNGNDKIGSMGWKRDAPTTRQQTVQSTVMMNRWRAD